LLFCEEETDNLRVKKRGELRRTEGENPILERIARRKEGNLHHLDWRESKYHRSS